jgi:hypothetical protein
MAWLQAFDTLAGHAAILLPSASVGGRVTRLVLLGSYRAMEGGCSDPQHPRHLPNGLASIKQALCPRPVNPCLRSSDPGLLLAAAIPHRVRSRIISRSSSATALMTWNVNLPAGVLVSMPSVTLMKSMSSRY